MLIINMQRFVSNIFYPPPKKKEKKTKIKTDNNNNLIKNLNINIKKTKIFTY